MYAQMTMLGMTIRRRPSSPSKYRTEFIARIKAARALAGKSHQEVADALGVQKNTYTTWELRTLMPLQHVIPFCQFVGADPYQILTGQPFRLGRPPADLRPVPTPTDRPPTP